MIINQKLGGIGTPTRYDFQYLPDYGLMTTLGQPVKRAVVETVQSAKRREGVFIRVLKLVAGGLLAYGVVRLGARRDMYYSPSHLLAMLISK